MLEHSSTTLIEGFTNHRLPPVNMPESERYLFDHVLETHWPDIRLLEYTDVNVTPESIVWKGLSIDLDLLIWPIHKETYTWKYTVSCRIKRKRRQLPKDETHILCTDYWADVYYHWIADTMPRLYLLREQLKNGVLLLPAQYTYPFYLESLEAFQIKKILRIPVKEYFSVPKLITVTQPTISGDSCPPLTRATRQHLVDHFKKKFTGKLNYPNIYISRSRAAHRKLLNEDQVLPLLKKYGFEVIHFEDYSFAEQVELCYNARNFITIHGSNVTNLYFMEPGSNALELRKDKDAFNHSFYLLAESVGINYYYLGCSFVDRRLGNYFDLEVDLEALEATIKQMLNGNS